MGSCFSSPEKADSADRLIRLPASLPEVKWELNESWTEAMSSLYKSAVESGNREEYHENYPSIFAHMVRDWLSREHPLCAEAGTIEDMGDSDFRATDGQPFRYPAKTILTLDEQFTGIMYSASVAISMPVKDSGNGVIISDSTKDEPEVEAARQRIIIMAAAMRESGVNFKHSLIHIFAGPDLYTCKFDASNTEPTVNRVQREPSAASKASNKHLAREARRAPDTFRELTRAMLFLSVLRNRRNQHPGSTTWDEGELPFNVNGKPYPNPTRLLITRNYKTMSSDEDAHLYKVIGPHDDPNEPAVVLLRNANPSKDPGGILCVTLFVTGFPGELWPPVGTYGAKNAAFNAAEEALVNYVKQLNREGKVQRCVGCVNMGTDQTMFKFVGEDLSQLRADGQTPAATQERAVAPVPQREQPDETSLSAFNIKLILQPQHELFESESHFQAIKQHLRERYQQDPTFFDSMAPQLAVQSAMRFLGSNYPGCDVSDEGDFPAALLAGKEEMLANTKLVVARDPKQAPSTVVGVVYAVPRPVLGMDPGHSWLDTPDIKAAEEALLALMKGWHAEGKVSKVDCMVQVMIGTDASIYQFVDGEKFVDYSDERMEQFNWQ